MQPTSPLNRLMELAGVVGTSAALFGAPARHSSLDEDELQVYAVASPRISFVVVEVGEDVIDEDVSDLQTLFTEMEDLATQIEMRTDPSIPDDVIPLLDQIEELSSERLSDQDRVQRLGRQILD